MVYRFRIPRRLRGEQQDGGKEASGSREEKQRAPVGGDGKRAARNTRRRDSEVRKQHYYYYVHTSGILLYSGSRNICITAFFLLLGNLMRHTIFLSYTFPHSPCKNKRRTSTSFDIRDLVKKEFSRDLSCPRQECGSVVQATTMWRRRSSNSPSSSFTDSTNLIVITPCYQPSSGYLVPFASSRCAPLDLCNHFIFTLPN